MASMRLRPAALGLLPGGLVPGGHAHTGHAHTGSAAGQGWDSLQFRVIFGLSFFAHLAVATGRRLDPRFWLEPLPQRSLVSEAWAASATTARMAFAG